MRKLIVKAIFFLIFSFCVSNIFAQHLPDSVQKFFMALPYDSSSAHVMNAVSRSSLFTAKEVNKAKTMVNARIARANFFKYQPDSAFIHVHENTDPADSLAGSLKGTVTVIRSYYSAKNKSKTEFKMIRKMLKEQTANKKFRMESGDNGSITLFAELFYPQINMYVEDALNGSKIIIIKIETPSPK